MTNTPEAVFSDSDTLLTLAQHAQSLTVVCEAFGERACVTTAVVRELTQAVSHNPPVPNARRALSAAQGMRVLDPSDLGSHVLDRMVYLRARLVHPGDAERKHLGEAASVACAEHLNGIVASDDHGARVIAKIAGVAVVGTMQLLNRMVETGRLSCADARAAVDAMTASGRSVDSSLLAC